MAGDGSRGGFDGESDGPTVDVEEAALHVALRRSLLEQGGTNNGRSSSSDSVTCQRSADNVTAPFRPVRNFGRSAPVLHVCQQPPPFVLEVVPDHCWVLVPAQVPTCTRTPDYKARATRYERQ
ncbi:hypothetical protein D1007_43546 [Hordeum vulgare]|nr:hypothetical protein D1007_43546 [Hordeum vulgare]